MTRRTTFVLFALLPFAIACYGDTLKLRNDEIITGAWLGIDGDQISFLVGSRPVKYPRSSVVEVRFDSEPSTEQLRTAPPVSPTPQKVQPAQPPPAPDVHPLNVVHFWNSAGQIVPIEHAAIVRLGGGGATWEIKGAKSPYRIRRAPAMLFLVWLPPGEDPNRIHLYRLSGGTARTPYSASGPGGAWRTVTLSISHAADSTGLAPVGELSPGEYAFVRSGSSDAYCFGIDP